MTDSPDQTSWPLQPAELERFFEEVLELLSKFEIYRITMTRQPHGLCWHGNECSTRLTLSEPEEAMGECVRWAHISTEVAIGCEPSSPLGANMAFHNQQAALSALTLSDSRGSLAFTARICLRPTHPLSWFSYWVAQVFLTQAAQAVEWSLAHREEFGERPEPLSDLPLVPHHGQAKVLQVYREMIIHSPNAVAPFVQSFRSDLSCLGDDPTIKVQAHGDGIAVEFSYDLAGAGYASGRASARLEVDPRATHPVWGPGLQLVLRPAIQRTTGTQPFQVWASVLNASEAKRAHFLEFTGAWSESETHGLEFRTFIPDPFFAPTLANYAVARMVLRVPWARIELERQLKLAVQDREHWN